MDPARKVSIIIPTYNRAKYLEEAVVSALAQTHRPIEILIVDDGSTDGTVPFARSLERDHPEVRVIEKAHTGRSDTFNRGVQEAFGSYVTIFSDDDRLHPEFCARLVAGLEERPDCDFAYSHAILFGHEETKVLCQAFHPRGLRLMGGFYGTSLIRRTAFERVGTFDTALETGEDGDWYVRCVRAGLKGVLVPHFLLYYRRYSAAHPNRNFQAKAKSAVRSYAHARRKLGLPLTESAAFLSVMMMFGFLGHYAPWIHDVFRVAFYRMGIGPLYLKSPWFQRFGASRGWFRTPSA